MSEAAAMGGTSAPGSAAARQPLSKWQQASYGAPALPLALAGLPVALYLPVIYTTSFGLSAKMIALVLLLARWGDFMDPIVGAYSDRFRSRWGRRKPFVLLGTPIYAAAIWLLFIPAIAFRQVEFLGLTFNIGYVYLFVTLSLVGLSQTIKDLPYSAWGAELSDSYHGRATIMSWREAFVVAGSLTAASVPVIVLFFGYTKPEDAVWFLVSAMCVLMPLFVLNALVTVPEYAVIEMQAKKLPFWEMVRFVRKNNFYMILLVIFAFSSIGTAMTNSLSLFFVAHVLKAGAFYGLYLFPYFVFQIAALPLWLALSRRIGKHRATMVAIGWYAFWSMFIPIIAIAPERWFEAFQVQFILGWLPEQWYQGIVTRFVGVPTGKFLFFIVVMCLKGSSIGALSALPSGLLADVVDADTLQSGKRQAGAYFAIWSFVRKLAYAIGASAGVYFVAYFGFDPKADPLHTTNTVFALLMLACLYSIVPAVFKFVAMPLLWKYPLTESRLKEIQTELGAKVAVAGGAS